ncbi:MAG: S8 family serine peptidase [Melioribacteraceae bacterium]
MLKKIFISLVILCLAITDDVAQLKKLASPNLYTEAEIYKDDSGNWYSTEITVKFAKETIDLKRGIKTASIADILIPNSKKIFQKVEEKYGRFFLEKVFPGSSWCDSIGINVVTKEKVRLKDESQFYKLKFGHLVCVDSLISELKGLPNIVSAERPFVAISTYQPNDYSGNAQWALPKIEATKAWDITLGASWVKIAINDIFTAWDFNGYNNQLHDDLVGKISYNPLYNCLGHGQVVAGCAAAATDNGQGIASIGYNSNLMFTNIGAPGIKEARDNGANIINCSWISTNTTGLDTVIFNTLNLGIIVTAASGNEQKELTEASFGTIPVVTYPAAYYYSTIGRQVIAVTATHHLSNGTEVFGYPPDGRWNHSPGTDPISNPTTSFVDFSAPGVFVKSLDDTITDAYIDASGTSLSAPEVAGVLALVKSIYSDLSPLTAYTILKNTSEKVGADAYDTNGWNQYMGYGRVNAYKALKYTIEHYGGTFNQNVILPAGDTWNLQPGVTLTFASGCALIVNGTLNAVGNSTSRITFTRSGSSGTWNGIQFSPGSSGNIQYCNINNAYYGIKCDNSSPAIIRNNIVGTSGSSAYGIYCLYGANPTITHNLIQGFSTGLYLATNSISSSTENFITGNTNGVTVFNSNGVDLGQAYWGYNNFSSNTNYELSANYSNPVWVQNNYWGRSYDPKTAPSRIYEYSATTYSTPFLTSPPSFNMIQESNDANATTGVVLKKTVSLDNLPEKNNDDDLLKIKEGVDGKRFAEVITTAGNMYKKEQSLNTKKYLLSVLQYSFRSSDREDFINYLDKTIRQNVEKNSEEYAATIEIENIWLAGKGKIAEVIENTEKLLADYPKNELVQRQNLFNMFYQNYVTLAKKEEAVKYYKELVSRYSYDILVENCEVIMAEESGKGYSQLISQQNTENNNKDIADTDLAENYPNPFNPSTQISFTLKENGKVSLKVYDVLGKEVANLAEGFYEAGKHATTFNGSNLASGIYFYRLTTPAATITKKMMLVK